MRRWQAGDLMGTPNEPKLIMETTAAAQPQASQASAIADEEDMVEIGYWLVGMVAVVIATTASACIARI